MWLFLAIVLAQGPPTFAPDDTEGLRTRPNPKIRHAWKRKVFWRLNSQSLRDLSGKVPPHTAAERQQMDQTLDRLIAIFKATPTGSVGEGFWVNESRRLGVVNPFEAPETLPIAKVPLEFASGLFPFYHEDVQGSNGQWRLSVNGETESVYYTFNRLPGCLQQPVIASEPRSRDLAAIDFCLRPRVTGTLAGLNIYEGTALLVTREGRDPWQAASVGRVLKAAMPAYEKDRKTAIERLDSYKVKNAEVQAPAYEQQMRDLFEKNNGSLRTTRPSNYEARHRSMEHELRYNRQRASEEANPQRGDPKGAWYWNPVDAHEEASKRMAALSPVEAAKPACFVPARSKDGRYAMTGEIEALGEQDCRPIVHTNWNYFDLKLPRSAPQILMVGEFGRCAKLEGDRIVSLPVRVFDAPPQGCVRHAQMWRELDWTKFAALVIQ